MDFYFTLLINILVFVLINEVTPLEFEQKHFVTDLNHFDCLDTRKVTLSYYHCEEYFKRDGRKGPLLIEIRTRPMPEQSKQPIYQLAAEVGADLIILEHRGYLSSGLTGYPTEDYYRYVNADQTMEDVAHFIQSYKETHTHKFKVVVHGCSYAGSLAMWLRYRYPHLVAAAWVNVPSLHGELNITEFASAVKRYKLPEECIDNFKSSYNDLEESLASSPNNHKHDIIRSRTWMWSGHETYLDGTDILCYVRKSFSKLYDQPQKLEKFCNIIKKSKSLLPFVLKEWEESNNCLKSSTTLDPDRNIRLYQLCMEFASRLTNDDEEFSVELTTEGHLIQYCSEVFPKRFVHYNITSEMLYENHGRKGLLYGLKQKTIPDELLFTHRKQCRDRMGTSDQTYSDISKYIIVKDIPCCKKTCIYENYDEMLNDTIKHGIEFVKKWIL